MKSIQRYLTLQILSTVLTVSVAAGAFLYLFARSRLTSEFDRALEAKARLVAGVSRLEDGGKVDFNTADPQLSEFRVGHHPGYFQVWRESGSTLVRSPSLDGRDLPRIADGGRPTILDVTLPDGTSGRAIAIRFSPRPDEDEPPPVPSGPATAPATATTQVPLTVVLAQDRLELDFALRVLASSLLVSGLALAIGTTLAVTIAVRRGLRPLHQLARQADSIVAASLHYRFPATGLPDELQPICFGLNNLLARLASAFARERRFTADAAHELRTPIAELRALAEVALKWPEDASAYQNYRDAQQIARQMEALVTTLLAMARCDAGSQPVQNQDVDLIELIREAWQPHQLASVANWLNVEWDLPQDFVVITDRGLLLQLIGNLLANAVAYTPARGRITCRLDQSKQEAALVISNDSDRLKLEDLPHLFEPFWRKDTARSENAHTGLGLSLVAAYADALGLFVRTALDGDSVFSIAVSFPGKATLPPRSSAQRVMHR